MVGHNYDENDSYDSDESTRSFFAKLEACEDLWGRPPHCLGCGEGIKKEIDDKGHTFYVCRAYRDDGTHVRISAIEAYGYEIDMLMIEFRKMRTEIDELKRLVKEKGEGSGGGSGLGSGGGSGEGLGSR